MRDQAIAEALLNYTFSEYAWSVNVAGVLFLFFARICRKNWIALLLIGIGLLGIGLLGYAGVLMVQLNMPAVINFSKNQLLFDLVKNFMLLVYGAIGVNLVATAVLMPSDKDQTGY